ncbi:hypothetical protein CBR_g19951 [Chara braunii]|uniref:Uncharacterized protein n=1 Tax=Chara braunii TaxID=69332 RepID=A0A388KZ41_CHABU|nr:hypothetical protein CBR_g19951 [Chara braunii]|eukprot:GBG75319.1 hypothetical protein CBR_g19951 [Chara braunii]
MNRHRLSTFGLPSDLPTFWKSATDAPLSFRVRQLDMPILEAGKRREWWSAYIALSFCLLEVVFHWAELANKDEEGKVPDDEVELLKVQAWRTNTEGELLGILFGKVRVDHLEPITSEVLVFLAQLLDDLPLDVLSRCDKRPTPATLTRTLAPHLLWSTCTEIDGDNCYYPSSGHYLVIDVTDLTLWDPIIRRGEERGEASKKEEEEEEEEEESLEAESHDPDYNASEEAESGGSGSDESGSPSEQSKEENEAAAEKRRERAEGKRSVEESDGPAAQLLQGDLARNLEPPQEEPGGHGVTTAEGSRSKRRRSSSPTQSSPPRPTIHIRGDAGARASSPVFISSSP